jgi:hypothetical protein
VPRPHPTTQARITHRQKATDAAAALCRYTEIPLAQRYYQRYIHVDERADLPMFATAHQLSRKPLRGVGPRLPAWVEHTAQRSPRDWTSRSGLCFAADTPRWPRRSGGQRRPRTGSSAHCRLGSEVRARSGPGSRASGAPRRSGLMTGERKWSRGGAGVWEPSGLGLEKDARLAVDGAVGVCSRTRPGASHDPGDGQGD